jgi:hypothetical protein
VASSASPRWWLLIVPLGILIAVIVVILMTTRSPAPPPASASASPVAAVSPTSAAPAGGGAAGGAVGAGNGAQGGAGGGGAGGGTSAGASTGASPEPSATPTQLADVTGGPYAVKQIETLGGESISGQVCSTSAPFGVAAHTSKVAWTFGFVPRSATAGAVSYAYSIPSAGESHQATGSYTISTPAADGILHVSLQVSDHVVFKGFDGKIPVRYKFDLVPTGGAACP